MARIDVSELMLDPDFVNNITIIRRSPSVNAFGENVLAESSFSAVASVQGVGKDALSRLPDGAKLSSMKTVYIKTIVYTDAVCGYADQIVWQGNRYNVITVLPWGNFGGGWYEVDVELEKASL